MVDERARREDKERREVRFTRRDIRTYTRWSDNQVRAHIWQLVEMEYLLVVSGSQGRRYQYELLYDGEGEDGTSFLVGITNIEELKRKAKKLGLTLR
jgi:hypothetical protein